MDIEYIDGKSHIYKLPCYKCQHVQSIDVHVKSTLCHDGIWFLRGMVDTDIHGIYCCTGCLPWFKKNAKVIFGRHRDWKKLVLSAVRKRTFETWKESMRRSKEFVVRVMNENEVGRKQWGAEKKQEKKRKREFDNLHPSSKQ